MADDDQPKRNRGDIFKAVFARPIVAVVILAYAVIAASQFAAYNFFTGRTASKLRLGNHLPHWDFWQWATLGLALALVLGFEGTVREIRKVDEGAREDRTTSAKVITGLRQELVALKQGVHRSLVFKDFEITRRDPVGERGARQATIAVSFHNGGPSPLEFAVQEMIVSIDPKYPHNDPFIADFSGDTEVWHSLLSGDDYNCEYLVTFEEPSGHTEELRGIGHYLVHYRSPALPENGYASREVWSYSDSPLGGLNSHTMHMRAEGCYDRPIEGRR